MGQNLSNGVYLPDEGERNCYSGLAANWNILNTAVGNIAGKASSSHSHGNITNDGKVGTTANLPLITGTGGAVQVGSFGNQANTFCEGNDSRLSDARTPVAHTHTKSDVTDLFNSANTWSGINTFTSRTLFHVTEDPTYVLKSSTMQEGVIPSGDRTAYAGYWQDKNANSLGYGRFVFHSVGVQAYEVNLRNKATNGSFSPSGSQIQSGFQLALHSNGNSEFRIYAHTLPNGNGTWNLGDSTHKWKTLNGINPGALSLPSSNSTDYIDLSSNLSTNAEYQYTAPSDGWLCLYVLVNEFYQENAVGLYRSDTSANSHQWAKSVTAAINLYKQNRYQGSVMLPVESGKKYICYLSLNANTTIHNKYLFFYKNKGNV